MVLEWINPYFKPDSTAFDFNHRVLLFPVPHCVIGPIIKKRSFDVEQIIRKLFCDKTKNDSNRF